jgi:tetratricopeptide (TPR) repeat protein
VTDRIAPRAKSKTSHEITVKFTPKKLIIPAAALILVVAIIVGLVKFLPKRTPPPTQPGISAVPAVAILYFKNNTGDKNLDIWRDGLCTSLIIKLLQSRYIRVLDQSQIYGILKRLNLLDKSNYTPEDLKEIAARGLATHIVQGSLSKAGDKFRIDLTLQNASTQEIIAPESADGTGEGSIFAMVDDLAGRLKMNLGLSAQQTASDTERAIGAITTNKMEAYKFYLQGFKLTLLNGWDEQAIAFFKKAVAADPRFAMAYLAMANMEWQLGHTKEYPAHYQKALDLRTGVSERERLLIEADYYTTTSESHWDKAIEAYTKLINLSPWDFYANAQLGYLYWQMDEFDKAVERLEVPRWYGNNSQPHDLIMNYLCLGQFEKAREVAEDYLTSYGDSALIRARLGRAYFAEGNVERAKKEIDRAYALSPGHAPTLEKFWLSMLTKDYAAAEPLLKNLNPNTAVVGARSVFFAMRGKLKEAKASLDREIETCKSTSLLDWTTVGCLYSAHLKETIGDFADALSASDLGLKGGKELDSISAACQALFRRGVVQARQNDFEAARRTADELRRTVESGPAKRRIYFYDALLGFISLRKGEFVRSQEYLQQAVGKTAIEGGYWGMPRPEFLDYLAEAYGRTGRWSEAQKAYEQIESLIRPIAEEAGNTLVYVRSFYKLGQVFEQMGKKAEAREKYRKFLDLWKDADAGLPEVADAKKRLAAL